MPSAVRCCARTATSSPRCWSTSPRAAPISDPTHGARRAACGRSTARAPTWQPLDTFRPLDRTYTRHMAVTTGDTAPDFTLKDQNGNDVTLSSFRGNKSVVLVFYPFTFTGVCEGELCSLRDDLSQFETGDAQV